MSRAAALRTHRPAVRHRGESISPILDIDDDPGDDQPAEWATPHWSSDEETPGLHVAEWDALDD